ncbi:MAG: hypothetical protein ACD_55C00025G0001 [uncultured bacterium]|nr:MAG: hypothetical protein ACD_55C00025G0001 [uncultured bacterium]
MASIFSASYWTYLPVHYYFGFNFSGDIVQEFIPQVLVYSILAALSFHGGALLLAERKTKKEIQKLRPRLGNPLQGIPPMPLIALAIRIASCVMMLYSYVCAIRQIGIGTRVQFMEDVAPLWYTTLLPLNMVLLSMLILYDFKRPLRRMNWRINLTLLLVLLHIVLVGFDGSRRLALPPVLILGVVTFFSWASGEARMLLVRRMIWCIVLLFLLSSLLGMNRDFYVGWQMFAVSFSLLVDYFPNVVSMVISPMSTLHVNTEMADYIASSGIQGFSYYVKAVGNTLFPRFLFGRYFFGEPLVVVLHERFGWYGQDFGFLAEAIYSGGMPAVAFMHLCYGVVVAKVLNGIAKGKTIFSVLGIGILFGALNSLRSDFMNLLKATLYPAIALYLVLFLFQKFKVARTAKPRQEVSA